MWRRVQAIGVGANTGGSIPHLAQQRHALMEEGKRRNGMACFSYWSWVMSLFYHGSAGARCQAIWSVVGKSCQCIQEDFFFRNKASKKMKGAARAQQCQLEEILRMEKVEGVFHFWFLGPLAGLH